MPTLVEPISSGWLGQIAARIRALFAPSKSTAEPTFVRPPATPSTVAAPLVDELPVPPEPELQAPQTLRPQFPRMLSARIACQAKLNVPLGKKPRVAKITSAKNATRRPKTKVEVKTTVNARSVYLPAKHLAAKTRPKPRNNVVALPIAAMTTRPQAKAPTSAKVYRIAA